MRNAGVSNKEIINAYILLNGHINIHIKQALQLKKIIYSHCPHPSDFLLFCLSHPHTALFAYNEQGKKVPQTINTSQCCKISLFDIQDENRKAIQNVREN